MRKRLLLAALAMVSVIGSYAYEVGDYAYTATQRLKIAGDNLVENGNFANGATKWYGANGTEAVNANVWQVTDGMGPNGEAVIESLGATADEPFCNAWTLPGGMTYIVSFQIKAPAYANSTVGTTVGNNYADFFLNTTGSIAHIASTEEAPVVDVATSFAMDTDWKDVAFVCTPEEGQYLVMHFEKFATGTQFTNIEIHQATEVYDDRIIRRKVAFADQILADPNFNESDKAQAAREEFFNGVYAYVLAGLNGDPDGANFDDIADAESTLEQFMEGLSTYMDASAENMATEANFKYVTDLTAFPKYNRGNIKDGQIIGGFIFHGDNWLHSQGGDVLAKQIQTGTNYQVGPGSAALYSTTLPAGKYYIAAEMRNANCDSKYNLTFNLERDVKAFIGTDSVSCGTIVGEEYSKFYMVGELKEGETFEAGFWWDGPLTGGRYEIKNFELRAFGNVKDEAERKAAWTTFIAQYNAAVSARKTLVELQSDANYPWEKDSLARALTQWDPYYNDIMAKGWVAEDGSDTRLATVEQLTDWADYQGVELYDGEGNLLKYQLVRGYQNAINYVKAQNKVFDDLKAEITKAETIRDDDMNQLGDKTTFQTAIDAAQNTLTTTLATTTDDTREADELTLNTAISTLQTAEETFKNSVPELAPFIDIDFSNNFKPVITTIPGEEGEEPVEQISAYVIEGAKGQMEFPTSAVSFDEGTQTYLTTGTTFGIGFLSNEELLCPGILRVGKGEGTVNMEAVGEDEVLRVQFDLYAGNLINREVYIDLRNESDERVAGFRLGRYSAVVTYNEFNDAGNTGLDILKYVSGVGSSSASNDAIAAENNKSSFDLIVDYKAMTLKGSVTNGKNGVCDGALMPWPTNLEDTKIVKFVLGSNYDNEARRSWFDNLKVLKYKSTATGPNEQVGITSVNANMQATGAIYTLSGMQVKGALTKGLYIKDGKKFVIK